MAERELKVSGKSVQKMTKDGLVEINLAEKTSRRISERGEDIRLTRNRSPDVSQEKSSVSDADFEENPFKMDFRKGETNSGGGKLGLALSEYRGEMNDETKRVTKKPTRRTRLRFTDSGESYEIQADGKLRAKLARSFDEDSCTEEPFNKEKALKRATLKRAQAKRYYYERQDSSGRRPKIFFDKEELDGFAEKESLSSDRLTKDPLLKEGIAGEAGSPDLRSDVELVGGRYRNYHAARGVNRKLIVAHRISGTLRHKVEEDSDGNVAVSAASGTQGAAERAIILQDRIIRKRLREKPVRLRELEESENRREAVRAVARGAAESENRKAGSILSRMLQKQQIKRDYARAKRLEETGTATVGTVDFIKKIGGKVTDFFKENRKVFIGIGVFFLVVMLVSTAVSSCGAAFSQNIIAYAGSSYLSDDEDIYSAELYYTQMEADLQERINRMRRENAGHEEYRYNIAPIQHDPFILISYLSAKYGAFTFDQVKTDLEELFAAQYQLETEAVNETVRETVTVRVGESLGPVVTSGYCNCSACCGSYAGGPTASGVMPVEAHTIAVDSRDPLVPMGTRIIMNGTEYVVEDTGPLNRYGVNFDVYYDDHDIAEAHGHQTWDAYIADDNGTEVEVTRVRHVNAYNVTLINQNFRQLCEARLTDEEKLFFDDYNEVRGNLQMFGKPVDFKWFNRVTGYYGYRVDPLTGNTENHNGMDIYTTAGTEVLSCLEGTVSETGYNDSYGNYVYLTDSHGYEVRYANLSSVNVGAGAAVHIGDVIGTAGSDNFMDSHLHLELLYHGERMNPVFYFDAGETEYPDIPVYSSGAVGALLAEAMSHLGTPYVWGGYDPSGFDCSGFVSWCLVHSGARNTGRLTAQELYDICTPISEAEAMPGDLIFFTGTYDSDGPVSHIGIYLGNGQMVHSGHPNQVSSIWTPYWVAHYYGFGRW